VPGGGVDVIHVRVYMKMSAGFTWGLNGSGVASTGHAGITISASYDGPGVKPNGTNHYMALFEPTIYRSEAQPGYLHTYCYHMNQGSGFGDHLYSDGQKVPSSSAWSPSGNFTSIPVRQPPLNQWFCVEMRGQANTPGQADGRVTVWLNGAIISDIGDLRFRTTSALKWDLIQIGVGQADLAAIPEPQFVWFDNLVVATSYIGPVNSGAVVNPPPPPPPLGVGLSPFASQTPPQVVVESDVYELGTTVRADVPGRITGLRLYQTSTGTRAIRLWKNGVQVATGTIPAGSGWLEVAVDVPAVAGDVFVVSVPKSSSQSYGASDGALVAAVAGDGFTIPANGGKFSPTVNTLPTQSFNASYYWTDVRFAKTAQEPTIMELQALITALQAYADSLNTRIVALETAPGPNLTAITSRLNVIEPELARLDARLDAISGAAHD
jgi:hypothetical protein